MEEESSLGRALAGGHIPSVAKAIVKHSALREAVFLLFLDELDTEYHAFLFTNMQVYS